MMHLDAAADFLGIHKETLRQKAKSNEVPGYKKFGRWYFFESELVEYLKSDDNQAVQNDTAGKDVSCQKHLSNSRKEEAFGTIRSQRQTGSAYAELLGLKTKSALRN